MQYRRAKYKGGYYFFTVNLMDRKSDLLIRKIDDLRAAFVTVKNRHPFSIVAIAVMPEHLHAIWRLPENDNNYPQRWSLIKAGFSRRQSRAEQIRESRRAKRERGIWQRRYWEHLIRNEEDLERHVNYIHYNPVKHGLVAQASDWPYSSVHSYIDSGTISHHWGGVYGEGDGFGER